MLGLQQLATAVTRAEGIQTVLDLLIALGFETTGWQDGRIQKTLTETFGTLFADLSEVAAYIAEQSHNETASGVGLKLLSMSRFDNTYSPAVRAKGPLRLTSTAQVAYTIEPGELIAADENGVEFRNTTGGTVAAGSVAVPTTLDLTFEARVAGSSGSVGNSTITRLLTPLAGVTILNNLQSPWYDVSGRDEESDAVLRLRNSTKWSTLTVEFVKETYENFALNGGASKVYVDDTDPRGPGTIDVYVSAGAELLGDEDLEAIQAYFAERAFQTAAVWQADWTGSLTRVALKHASTQALDLAGVVYHSPDISSAEAKIRTEAALTELLRLTPLGGWDYTPGPAHVMTISDLADTIKNVDGNKTLVLTSPAADVTVAALALLIQGNWDTLTYTPVAA